MRQHDELAPAAGLLRGLLVSMILWGILVLIYVLAP